uniref:Putative secreted protein n=1 Tax=Amblyomma triste TaxID=251400 RepID=A0A023G1Z6_AMBTT
MKVSLVLLLLTVSTSAYAATLDPLEGIRKLIPQKDDGSPFTVKTEEAMQTLSKLLHGEVSFSNAEDRASIFNALETLETSWTETDDTEKYLFKSIMKAVGEASIHQAVATIASEGINTLLNKIKKKD